MPRKSGLNGSGKRAARGEFSSFRASKKKRQAYLTGHHEKAAARATIIAAVTAKIVAGQRLSAGERAVAAQAAEAHEATTTTKAPPGSLVPGGAVRVRDASGWHDAVITKVYDEDVKVYHAIGTTTSEEGEFESRS